MSTKKNVPEIRFMGFSGDWEEKFLGEIGTLKNGMNFDKTAMGHGHPFVNLQDVFGKNEVSNNNLGLAFSTANQRKEYSLNTGDILFIRSSVKPEGVGEAAVISKRLENTTYSGFIIRFRPNIEMDINFNRFVYSTTNSRRQILASSTSSANSNINQYSLQRIQLTLPCKTEQTKIGNYFQQLDSLIAQHQQKHDKLLNLKKSLLEKMFPKQGATVPDIRFKGFSGEWEEMALGELTDYKNGRGHEDKQKTYGKYELVNLNSVAIDGGLKHSGKFINETESTLDENDLVMVLSDVAHGNLLGRVALIPTSNTYVLNQRVALLRPSFDIFPLFILYNINAHQSYFKAQGAGMSQLNISRSSVENFSSYIPKKSEQTKIGNFFKQLDTLLTQHQAQLKKLNNIKQACLEKMFV